MFFDKRKYRSLDELAKQNAHNIFSSDEELLEHVQRQTFRYFWDFAHPQCGAIRERNSENYKDVITSGGTGFGLMTIIVAVERGWIKSYEAQERIIKILRFLSSCETYHGAYAHWYDAYTGKTIPFSKKDNGADLVETSFLMMGMLTVRQYFSANKNIVELINTIWYNVDWIRFTRGKEVLYWHESNTGKNRINLKIEGYNEALITYVLAAASPNNSINKNIYDNGWARSGAMKNGKRFFNIHLPLGPDYGGPLFFAHYSFLGLDPRGLKDDYADYEKQNVAHAKINHAYCGANPKKYKGYSDKCWGLSACDTGKRYKPHSPEKDNGTICPSAAIASMPYLPVASMKALKYFYYELGNQLWGEYGFYDGFNVSKKWFADSYLAINQAPVILMIENYRSGLLWNMFMSCVEVKKGLKKLGFK